MRDHKQLETSSDKDNTNPLKEIVRHLTFCSTSDKFLLPWKDISWIVFNNLFLHF